MKRTSEQGHLATDAEGMEGNLRIQSPALDTRACAPTHPLSPAEIQNRPLHPFRRELPPRSGRYGAAGRLPNKCHLLRGGVPR